MESLENLSQFLMGSLSSFDAQAQEPPASGRNTVPLEDVDWAVHIPALQRFYGAASPTEWERLPFNRLEAHLNQMEAIRAEEALHWVTIIAVGNGLLKRHRSRQIIREWRSAGNSVAEVVKQKPESKGSVPTINTGVWFFRSDSRALRRIDIERVVHSSLFFATIYQ